jgi:N-acetyldiaminopimelate deacetylase
MIVAASAFVMNAQTIVSRNVNPIEGAVVTFGNFHGGTAGNIIAGEVHIDGTIRTLSKAMNDLTQKRMRDMARGVEEMYSCEIDLQLLPKGYLPVENNEELTKDFFKFIGEHEEIQFQETEPAMTGEDFGYLLSKVPGVMFWLGVDTPYPLHHSKMSPNEEAIFTAVDVFSQWLTERAGYNALRDFFLGTRFFIW